MRSIENKHIENGIEVTFWDIISHLKIEIPVIQRDYAQGRITNRINSIRKKFIQELVEIIKKDDAEPMHLNFVYGRIEGKNQKLVFNKNKEAIENILLAVKGYADQCSIEFDPKIKIPDYINDAINSIFIPLDGQQRLTTLYLLHWYLLKNIEIENKDELLKQLSGFSYKTRNSTKEFCDFIIAVGSNLSYDPERSISEIIEESPDFFKIWNRDPSVKGMLTTLNEFHELFKDEDKRSYISFWNNLTTNRKIVFDFLDLDEYEQTDELYVKMNARGKQLSDFEHFKSWLHEFIKSKSIIITEKNWSDKIDTRWLDLFWKNRKDNTFAVDEIIYNFLKSINLYEYVNLCDKEIINKELINKIREPNEEKNFISMTDYEDSNFFSSISLDFTFSCLNKLANIDLEACNIALKDVTKYPFIDSSVKLPFIFLSDNWIPTLPDRVFYYSFLLFVNDISVDISNEDSMIQLKKWLRICRNLIYNTYIQSPDNFIDAIKAIKEFSTYKNNVEEELLKEGFSLKFFDTQLKEETLKIQYFNKGENWKSRIIESENHTYFYGQIGFIFKLLDDPNDYSKFEFYANKLAKIFDNPEANGFLFYRLLLSKGDYLNQSNSKWSFCETNEGSLRTRQDNWRKVFNDDEKLEYLKVLLNESTSIDISDNSIMNYPSNNWKSFFIKEKYTGNMSYINNRLIYWENDWDIKLLNKTTFTGKHADLYSHSLFFDLKINIEGLDLNYIDVNGRRTDSNKPKIEAKVSSNIITIFYEPYYSNEECAFIVEFNSVDDLNLVEEVYKVFLISGRQLIYKIKNTEIVENYAKALEAITNLLRAV